jgi:UDP-N-acetyl-D-mannosaminuronic acid transferase (WecB/TagA/CpsF family)
MSAPNPQTFCQGATVTNLTASGTPGATISWFTSSMGWQSGQSPLATSTQLVNNATYYAGQSFGTNNLCKYVGTAGVQVVINSPAAPTGAATQTFCNSATVANLSATGTSIQWYTASTGGTALSAGTALTNGTTYYASQTESGCESANRLAVAVTINITDVPTGMASQSFCSGATVGSLSATGTGIQWYSTSTGGTPLLTSTPLVDGAMYYASQTLNGCESAGRLAVTAIFGIPSAPTGSAAQTFCNSATVANLAVSGSNIQWYAAATGGSALTSGTTLSNGTTYYASQTSGGCESTDRFAVTVTINVPTTPTGTASQVFCNSATVANLTATGSGIQWYASSTGGSALSIGTALTNSSTYYATQTISGCESANRFAVAVTINVTATPTGSSAQTFCNSGTVADLTATGTGIQWYSASTGGSALSAGTSLTNGTTYYASQTVSGCESANRFAVAVTINAPVAPTGTAAQTFCNSATVADLTATGTDVQWYAASTGGTALSAGTVLANGTSYYASQTVSGCESANRFAVAVTINAPAAPTGTAAQTFCNSATVADLTATGTGIQWYSVSTGGSALAGGTTLVNGTTYYASQTISGCESANRFAVAVTINVPAAPSGTSAQTFCNSGTVADLTATGTGVQWYSVSTGGTALSAGTALVDGSVYYASQTISGCEGVARLEVTATINAPSSPTGASAQTVCTGAIVGDLTATGSNIQWYSAPTGGSPLTALTALTDGTTYYATQSVNGCESVSRFAVTVTFGIPSAPTGSATQTFCNSATVADLSATGSNIQWYTAITGGTALASGTALADGGVYYASQSSGSCESPTRLEVSVTINAPAAPTGTATQTFCNSGTVSDLTATGSGIQWYTASTGGTSLSAGTPLVNGTYYASQTISGCESATRLAVAVTINAPAAPTGATSQIICGTGTLDDLTVSGTNITWYDAPNGNTLAGSTPVSDGSSYYATQTVNGCESVNELAVTVSINAIPAAPAGTATQEFCNSATIADLSATGTGINWYADAVSTTPLNSTTALSNGAMYYATQIVNGCESADRLEVAVTINTPAAPAGSATQSFCSAATVNDLTATGTSIAWYTSATGGTALAGSTALSSGTYYASQTINGCESANRLAVAVTVTILNPNVTVSGVTMTAVQTGASYTWVDCNNGNQPIAGANAQSYTATANGSYAVEIELNGCTVTSVCETITSVGLEDDKVLVIGVQPNPTSGVLNISVSYPTSAVITTSNGTVVASLDLENVKTIDVSSFAMGVYYIRTAEGQTVKFIKE